MKKNKTKLEKKVENYNELEKKNKAFSQDLAKTAEYYIRIIEDYKKDLDIVVGQNKDIVNHFVTKVLEESNANTDKLSKEERLRKNLASLRQNGFFANLEMRGNGVYYTIGLDNVESKSLYK